ncbi:hypothetical protein BH09SUM1_BH09SUM1_10390 [soil metagenome]
MRTETPIPESAEEEITRLVHVLHETQQRLQELAGGEVDAVVYPGGQSYLLHDAQKKLLESETVQRASAATQSSILNAIPANIALLDHDGVILSVNESWLKFAGLNLICDANCGIGQNYLEVCEGARGEFSAQANEAGAGIRTVLNGDAPDFTLDYPCHSLTQQRWFRLRVNPLNNGGLRGAVVMHLNITETKLAEEAVRASERIMAAAQRIAHFGSWELDLTNSGDVDENPLWWSDEMYRIAGYEPGAVKVTNELFFQLVPPEEQEGIRQAVAEAIREHKQYSIVHRIIQPSGQERFVRETGAISFDDETGQPSKMIGTAHDVTEQRRAEEKMHRQQTELRVLIDLVPAMIWFKDTKNNILRVNKLVAETAGKSIEEIEGKPSSEIYPREAAQYYADDMAVMRSGIPKLGYVETLSGPQGEELWVQTDKVPYYDADGKVAGIAVMAQDITGRKRAEMALKESEFQYRSLFENMLEGYSNCRMIYQNGQPWDFVYLEANKAFETLTGLKNVVGKKITEVIPGIRQTNPEIIDIYGRVAATRRPESHEIYVKALEIWLAINIYSYESGHFTVLFHNITERKRIEMEMRFNAQRYRSLVEATTAIVWSTPGSAEFKVDQPSWRAFTGQTVEEHLGWGWLNAIHPDDRAETAAVWSAAVESRSIYKVEHRLQTPDQGYRNMMVRAVPIFADDGTILQWMGVHTDITERKQAVDALHALNAELDSRVFERTQELASAIIELQGARIEADRANMAKSEFLSHMSHELRTPLNSTLGFAQVLQRGKLDERQAECVGHILTAGNHLLGLINEVLEIARIEAGQISIQAETVSVLQIAQEACSIVRPSAHDRGIVLCSLSESPADLRIVTDPKKLKQVLLNLLSNAVKYNRQGGTVALEWSLVPSGRVRFSVTDSGHGISPLDIARLFTPFERLNAAEKGVAGTGLGLVVTRRIVEAMGGSIGVTSELGKGSTFWCEILPSLAGAGAEPTGPTAVEKRPDDTSERPKATGTILYVEDDRANVRLMERIMERRPGVKLVVATMGADGLNLARTEQPRAILLDMHLPDMEGAEVLEGLKADPLTAAIPVIIVSGVASDVLTAELKAFGVRASLAKPIKIPRLLELIDDILKR